MLVVMPLMVRLVVCLVVVAAAVAPLPADSEAAVQSPHTHMKWSHCGVSLANLLHHHTQANITVLLVIMAKNLFVMKIIWTTQ